MRQETGRGLPTTVDVSTPLIGGDRSEFHIALAKAPVLRPQFVTEFSRVRVFFVCGLKVLDRFCLYLFGQNLSSTPDLHSVYSTVRALAIALSQPCFAMPGPTDARKRARKINCEYQYS